MKTDYKDLYMRNAFDCSRITTVNYSTSFSMGIRLLGRRFRNPVYAVYGFVRYADEIVDTFFDQDQEKLIKRFRADTYEAIDSGFSTNPLLHSFQWVVNQYGIDSELIDAFLKSMEMDLDIKTHDDEGFSRYVYGSAEVVGLICLRIFLDGNEGKYREMVPFARRLGEAFQKVNFLRDLKSDHADRGRIYFPELVSGELDQASKKKIETAIEEDFRVALEGVRKLDRRARVGVYTAYSYYRLLFARIKKTDATDLLNKRLRINNFSKLLIMTRCYLMSIAGIIR